MNGNKRWYNIELNREEARSFKLYLRVHNITYESSESYDLIHFECLMTPEEMTDANKWLEEHFDNKGE